MSDLKFDIITNKRYSENQLRRSGLLGLDRFVDLVSDHDYDLDLYIVVDTGRTEVRESTAYIVFEKKRMKSTDKANIKDIMRKKITTMRDIICASGLAFEYDGESAMLQTRDVDWVTLNHLLRKAERAVPEETMEIRVESNDEVTLSAAAVIALIEGAITYRNAVIKAASTLKDQISAAADDNTAYDVYEAGIETIWPDNSPIEL